MDLERILRAILFVLLLATILLTLRGIFLILYS